MALLIVLLIGFALFCIVAVIWAIFEITGKHKKWREEAEQEKLRQEAEDQKCAEDKVQEAVHQLTNKYGRLSNTIRLEKWGDMPDIKKCLLFFGESELLYVDGREVWFKDIISYCITDDNRIIHGEVEYTSKTSTSMGSLLGRSAVGTVLGGGLGAVIGASSASKNTTTIGTQKNDIIIHRYSLLINVRSLEDPLIRINLGSSTKKAEEVNAIFAYIIASKRL